MKAGRVSSDLIGRVVEDVERTTPEVGQHQAIRTVAVSHDLSESTVWRAVKLSQRMPLAFDRVLSGELTVNAAWKQFGRGSHGGTVKRRTPMNFDLSLEKNRKQLQNARTRLLDAVFQIEGYSEVLGGQTFSWARQVLSRDDAATLASSLKQSSEALKDAAVLLERDQQGTDK